MSIMTKKLHVLFFDWRDGIDIYHSVCCMCSAYLCLSWGDRTSMILPTIDCFLFDIGTPMHPPVMQDWGSQIHSEQWDNQALLFTSTHSSLHSSGHCFFPLDSSDIPTCMQEYTRHRRHAECKAYHSTRWRATASKIFEIRISLILFQLKFAYATSDRQFLHQIPRAWHFNVIELINSSLVPSSAGSVGMTLAIAWTAAEGNQITPTIALDISQQWRHPNLG